MVSVVLCIILIIILSFFKKKSTVIFILLSIIGSLIVGLNFDNPDYENYVIGFQNALIPDNFNIFEVLDIGNKIILAKSKDLGFLNYEDFRLYYSIILFIVFALTIFKYCKLPAFYMGLYILFYLALDEVQFRNFSSFVILLPFIIYYIHHQNKKGLIIFLFGIFIAFTLHFSAIFYGMFCLTVIKSKSLRVFLICLMCILFVLMGYLESQLAFLDHVEDYERPSILGAFFVCFFLFANYFYIRWIEKKYVGDNNSNSKACSVFYVIVQINLLLLMICPAIFINSTVTRIWRFVSLVNLIFILNIISLRNIKNNRTLVLSSVIYSLIVSSRFNFADGVFDSILNNPLFE